MLHSLFLLFLLLVTTAFALDDMDMIPVTVVADFHANVAASAAATTDTTHYEKPPCMSDEKAVQVFGIDGSYCAPQCKEGSCPSDVPDGVNASPVCALQAPDGSKFCAILCSPSSLRKESVTDEQCGPMTCQIVPGQSAMGICTYPSAKASLEE